MMTRRVGALTHEEVSRLSARSIVLLPLGSMEQHGPHLPLDTDTVIATGLAEAIVERHGEAFDLWMLPTFGYGLSREHAWAAGTMTLSVTAMATMLREIGREIVRALPARHLMIVNAHGGNRGILDALSYELKDEFGLTLCVLHAGALLSPVPESGLPEIHGGSDETSVMLALAPERVQRGRVADGAVEADPAEVRARVLDPGVSWPWSSGDAALADNGVMGDARGASAERGHALVERVVTAAGEALARLRARD